MGINKQSARIKHHTSTTTGSFTVPSSEDFTDGSWDKWDLAKSEIAVNEADETVSIRIGSNVYDFYTTASPISSSNIGNSDLTINTSGARKLILGGALTSDYFVIRNSADSADYLKVRGDGGIIMSDQVGVGITPNGNQSFYAYTNSRIYAGSFLTQASNGTALSAQASLNGNCTAIKVTNTTAGGSGTRHGIVFDVRNGINNYAIKIDNGDIKFDTTTGTKIGSSTSDKLSFWNATPVVQPTTGITSATFTANTSGIVDDTATFDGYTIGQVVKALRTIGILA